MPDVSLQYQITDADYSVVHRVVMPGYIEPVAGLHGPFVTVAGIIIDERNINGMVRRLTTVMTISCRRRRSAKPLEKAANPSPSSEAMRRASSIPGTPVLKCTPIIAATIKTTMA